MLMLLEICPGCGQEVEGENLPAGLCPECLLRRGAELVDTADHGLLNTPNSSPTAFNPPDPVELEAELPGYDVFALLGRGGMGAVYKARQRGLDRIVALKILPRMTGEQPLSDRFEREARALARLSHENIVMAYDFGVTERYAYCVMEFVDGPNLRELMELEGIDPARALEIVRDICLGLEYAHQSGVVHRDIKPENVLIGFDGQVKIADFGLAKLLTPEHTDLALTQTRHFMGTVHYMAPEQVERPREVDHRVDIYSTGVLLYEMLTGELPLGRFENPSAIRSIDARVDAAALKALEKDPGRRYQSAAELASQCEELLSKRATPAAMTATSASGGANNRRRMLIAGGLFGFVGLVLLGWQLLLEFNRDKDGGMQLSIKASGDGDAQSKPQQQQKQQDQPNRPQQLQQPAQSYHPLGDQTIWSLRGHELLNKKLCGDCHTPQSLGVQPTEDPKAANEKAAEAIVQKLDNIILEKMKDAPLQRSADDAEFARRAWLDLFGTPPTKEQINEFANDTDERKREKLVYELWMKAHKRAEESEVGKRQPTPNEAFDEWINRRLRPRNTTNDSNPEPDPNPNANKNKPRQAQPEAQDTGWQKPSEGWRVPGGPSEDLPIFLKSVYQHGEYPDKRLDIQFEKQEKLIDAQSKYMLVLSAAHGGIHQLPIDMEVTSAITTRPLPKLSDGDPVELFIAVQREGNPPLRASNIMKFSIQVAGAPKEDIRFSDKLLSPFKAIHWEEDTPQVRIGERWYELVEIDGVEVVKIMEKAKEVFPDNYQRAFEQDLLELLGRIGKTLSQSYTLKLRSLPRGEEETLAGFRLTSRERAITEKIESSLAPPKVN